MNDINALIMELDALIEIGPGKPHPMAVRSLSALREMRDDLAQGRDEFTKQYFAREKAELLRDDSLLVQAAARDEAHAQWTRAELAEEQLAEFRSDAERYRWLRAKANIAEDLAKREPKVTIYFPRVPSGLNGWVNDAPKASDLDIAIDSEIAKHEAA